MSEPINIEVKDSISPNVEKKLIGIAKAADTSFNSTERLKASLKSIDTSAFNKLAAASAKVTSANARLNTSNARLLDSQNKVAASNEKLALAKQKVATESQRTAAAESRATSAANAAEKSALALANAKSKQANASSNNAREAQRLRDALYPLEKIQREYRDALMQTERLYRSGAIGEREYADAVDYHRQKMVQSKAAFGTYTNSVGKASAQTNLARGNLVNLGYQLNDVFVSLASGQKPLTVFIQQGSQIAGIASSAGVGLGTLARAAVGMLAPFLPLVAVLGTATAGIVALNRSVASDNNLDGYARSLGATDKQIQKLGLSSVSFGDDIKGLGKTIADYLGVDSFDGFVSGAKSAFANVGLVAKTALASVIALGESTFSVFIEIWRRFPVAFKEPIAKGINQALQIIDDFLNSAVDGLNFFISTVNKATGATFALAKNFSVGRVPTEFAKSNGKSLADTFVDSYTTELAANKKGIDNVIAKLSGNIADAAKKRIKKTLEEANKEKTKKPKKEKKSDAEKLAEKRAEAFRREVASLQSEYEELQKVGKAQEIEQRFQEISNRLKNKGITLNDTQAESLRGVLETLNKEKQINKELNAIYDETQGKQEQLQAQIEATNKAYKQGLITKTQYQNKMLQNKFDQADQNLSQGDGSAGDIGTSALSRLVDTSKTASQQIAETMGDAAESIQNGFGDAFADAIVGTKSFGAAMKDVARNAIGSLLSGLIKIGTQQLILATLGRSLQATTAATTAATAGAAAAAWAPAAALASLATVGANTGPATAALATTTALSESLATASSLGSFAGFEKGGYTGNAGTKQVAGLVHGQEFVMNADATAQHRSTLEAMNRSGRSSSNSSSGSGNNNASFNINISKDQFTNVEVEYITESEARIIAKHESKKSVREDGPKVIADQYNDPNSRVSKAQARNTKTERRRN